MSRKLFTPFDTVKHVWNTLELPNETLASLQLTGDTECYPSSFKVDHLAQASIAGSALAAALFYSTRYKISVPKATVPVEHACVEFKSERLYMLHGKAAPSAWGTIGGLHKTADGYVRIHDSFPNHRSKTLAILGLGDQASRQDVVNKVSAWNAVELESTAIEKGAVIAALRSFEEWDALPQAAAVSNLPILLGVIFEGSPSIDLSSLTRQKPRLILYFLGTKKNKP